MAFDPISLALSKNYTKATAAGMGAIQGEPGPQGPPGAQGEPGRGVPPGGAPAQILAKAGEADYNAEWVDGVTMKQVNGAIAAAITGAIEKVYDGT